MSSRHEKDACRLKKPYTKPEVKQVSLKPEEAVLGGCKVTQVNSPNTGMGYTCSTPIPCSAVAS
jgi:hypothetical protein